MTDRPGDPAVGGPSLELVPAPDTGVLAAARLAAEAAGLDGAPDGSTGPYASAWRQAGLREGVAAADGLHAAAQHARGGAGVVEG